MINTDNDGKYHSRIAVMLLPGNYKARFYVKDTGDWKIVLYYNYFRFSAKNNSGFFV